MSELAAAVERIKKYIEKEKHTYGNTLFLNDLTVIINSTKPKSTLYDEVIYKSEGPEEPKLHVQTNYNSDQWETIRNNALEELNKEQDKKEDALQFYQNNFGSIRPIMAEELIYWTEDTSDELVILAMRKALEQNKPSWSYAKAILKRWVEQKITTVEQVNAADVEFENRRQNNGYFVNKFQIDEEDSHVNPEWLKKGEHMKKHAGKQEVHQEETEMEKRLKELMKAHSEGVGADE